jgi:DNA polymerase-1
MFYTLDDREYKTYLTFNDYNRYLNLMRQSEVLIIDTEGTLNHPNSTTWGISTAVQDPLGGVRGDYFAFNHQFGKNLPKEWFPAIKEVIENHPCLGMHGAKHDLRALRSMGINYRGKFYCTQQMIHWVDENIPSKELDYLSKMIGNQGKQKSDLMNNIIKAFGWSAIPADMMRHYAHVDATDTLDLFNWVKPRFIEQDFDGELWDVEQDWIRVISDLEDVGLVIDEQFCESEYKRGTEIMREIQKNLGFNPGSPKELGKFILEDLGLPVVKPTKKGNPSFDKEAMKIYDEQYLSVINDNRAKQIATWRGWQKVTSSSYKPFLEMRDIDGRLHPSYKLHGTKTGRMSCGYFQQIPRESVNDWNGQLKTAFIPDEGYSRHEGDFSQAEFRLGAAYGREKRLIEIFNDDSRDMFTETAAVLGLDRNDTKTMMYTLQFLGGAGVISRRLGRSEEWAREQVRNYWRNHKGIGDATKKAEAAARLKGYVRYWSGRRRHFKHESEYHKAFNSVCQGGVFEIVKRAMVRLVKEGIVDGKVCRMDIQTHDSAGFLIEKGKEKELLPEIKRCMENVKADKDFGVRFKVDVKEWVKR